MNMFTFFTFYTIIFYVLDTILIEKNYKKEEIHKSPKAQKNWELISNISLLILLTIILIVLIFKFKFISNTWCMVFYGFNFMIYIFKLFEILTNQDEGKLDKIDIHAILYLPILICQTYNLFSNYEFFKIDITNINCFIIVNVLKNFIYSFFSCMYFFIFIKEIKKFLNGKKLEKKNKRTEDFIFLDFIYENSKNKKRYKVYIWIYIGCMYTFV